MIQNIWEYIFLKEFFSIAIIFMILEYFFPLKKYTRSFFQKNRVQDVYWLYINEHITPNIITAFFVFLNLYIWKYISRYLNLHITTLNLYESFLLILLYKDLMFYIAHTLVHRIPSLWKIHILHHSSTRLDWLAGFRGYWLDNLFFEMFVGSIFLFVSVPDDFFKYWISFELIWVFYIHSNIKINTGFLKKWINGPHAHHWHHSDELIFKGGQNFGAYTLIWDNLFKTFYLNEKNEPPLRYGIKQKDYPSTFFARLFYPFR